MNSETLKKNILTFFNINKKHLFELIIGISIVAVGLLVLIYFYEH